MILFGLGYSGLRVLTMLPLRRRLSTLVLLCSAYHDIELMTPLLQWPAGHPQVVYLEQE